MDTTYKATYINASGRHYTATVFISSVTLTLRYKDENNEEKDIYWLAEKIQSMEQGATDTRLHYLNMQGKTEQLVIRDLELLAEVKKRFRGYKFIGGIYHHTIGKTRNKILLLLGIVVAIIVATYFWFMPWLGERVAMNFSKEYEIDLGESMYKSTISAYKVDSAKTRVLNEFYKELHFTVDYPISITVVEAKDVNAFAIPGGHIIVHDAILEGMKTPEELAALLAHEASHIAKRHSLRSLFRSLARQMFISLLFGNDSGILSYIANNADALKGLEYSRSLESDADNNGMRMMAGSGLNTDGMMRLMEMLQKEAVGKEPSAFMSTHPVFKDRIENIRKEMSKYPAASRDNPKLKKLFHDLYEEW